MALIKNLLDKYRSLNLQLKVVVWFTFAGFLQKGISVITTPIFTRVLSTDDYGLFSVFNAWYGVAAIVATLYLHNGVINNAFVKLKTSQERIVSSFQSLSLLVSVVAFVICTIFRKPIAEFIKLPQIVVVVAMFGLIFMEPYHNWMIYKRYNYKYVQPVAVTIIVSVLTPLISLIAILLIKSNQGVVRIITFVLINTVLPGLLFYVVNYIKGKNFYDKVLWKYAISFNVPLIPHYLSEILLNQIDKIMINMYFGSGKAGIYGVAYSAASLILIFTSAMNTAFVPWQYQKLQSKSYKPMAKMAYLVLTFVFALSSLFMLFAPEIVMVLAGEKYMGAVYLIPTLCSSVFFNYLYQLFSRVELYYEKKIYSVVATISATVLNFLLNLVLLPRFGYLAAGFSSLISHILFCVLHFYFYRLICKKFLDNEKIYSGKIILMISAAMLIVALLITLLYNLLIIRLCILLVAILIAVVFRRKIIENVTKIIKK